MAEFPKAFAAGWPNVNPLLPEIYRYWLQVYNLKGSYDAVPVDANSLPHFLADMKQRGFVGGTISQPHKEAAFALVAKPSACAKRLQAVNHVWLEGDVLCGDNSDAQGFAANLDAVLPGWAGDKAVILGADYAARAVLDALASRGFSKVFVAAAVKSELLKWTGSFGRTRKMAVKAVGLNEVNACLPKAHLVVHTGALGVSPPAEFDFMDFRLLPKSAAAADIVYYPQQTVFLQAAAAAGLKTANGLGMLLCQAVPGFVRWFGQKPQADAGLRRFIAAKIPA